MKAPDRFEPDRPDTPSLMPTASEIPWTLPPVPRLENLPVDALLALDDPLSHVADLREELRAVRELLHQALALVADTRQALAKAHELVDFQREEIRRYIRGQFEDNGNANGNTSSNYKNSTRTRTVQAQAQAQAQRQRQRQPTSVRPRW